MRRYQLTRNFFLDEFTRSQAAARHGIDMSLSSCSDEAQSLMRLCETVLQPLRDALGPVHITSGYRPFALNLLIGGSSHSQHIRGQAADIVVAGRAPLDVSRWIYANIGDYDQLIHEFGQWTHVSVAGPNKTPRRQPLTSWREKRTVRYAPGIAQVERSAA